MKYLFALLLTCYLMSSASPQENRRAVDLKINGVGAGISYSAVVKKLGKPLRTKGGGLNECSGGYSKTLFYDGWEIEFLSDEKKRNYTVTSMNLTSPKWSIASDLKIGNDIETVRAKFGQPGESSEKDVLGYDLKDNTGWVNFHFRHNKLVKVEMAELLC